MRMEYDKVTTKAPRLEKTTVLHLPGTPADSRRCWCTALIVGALILAANGKRAASAVVEGNTAFALDLYHRVRTQGGNLFFSPYSISTALAMTYAGARGQTEKEMARVLHFTLPQAELHCAFAELAERFAEIEKQGQISLIVANSLWCEQTYPFLDTFLDLNRKHYRAEVRLVDFVGRPEPSRREINAWVEEKTHGKIRDLIQPGQITEVTTLVLCNAIYFKGLWLTQFRPDVTRVEPFFIAKERKVNAPLMRQTLRVQTHATSDAVIFALPYAGEDLSLVVLLPKTVDGLEAIESQLTAARLQTWLTALDKARGIKAVVYLPRFKLTCRLDLAGVLAAMGMPSAFRRGADFSGISHANDLFISHVVHQAFVDVNEEGTEAAGATGVVVSRTAVEPTRPLELRVDHPFLFIIRERQTGSILFLGRVVDPTN